MTRSTHCQRFIRRRRALGQRWRFSARPKRWFRMIEVTERCSVGNDAAGTTYDDPSATHDLSDERATAGDVRRKLITVSRFNAGDRPVQGRSATDTVSAQRKRGASSPAHARRLTCASARAGKSSVRQVRVIIFGFVRDNASTACLKHPTHCSDSIICTATLLLSCQVH